MYRLNALHINIYRSIHSQKKTEMTKGVFCSCMRNCTMQNLCLSLLTGSFFSKAVKGTMSRDGYVFDGDIFLWGYFFKGPNILISIFCVCADDFQGLLKAFYYSIQLLTFCLLIWNYLLIVKNALWNPPLNSFSVIGRCSQVPNSHWLHYN